MMFLSVDVLTWVLGECGSLRAASGAGCTESSVGASVVWAPSLCSGRSLVIDSMPLTDVGLFGSFTSCVILGGCATQDIGFI